MDSNGSYPRIGGITIQRLVARRALNSIYKGYHHATGGAVAVKMHTSNSAKLRAYFAQEVRTLQTLCHLSMTPRYIESGTIDTFPFHVCVWTNGSVASEIIDGGCEDDLDRIVLLVRSVARCVETLHFNGFCHRDISPEHIYRRDDGSVLIIDYGMACPFWSLGAREKELYAGYDLLAVGMLFCELLLARRVFGYRTASMIKEIAVVWKCLSDTSLLPAGVLRALKYALGAPSEFGCIDASNLVARPGRFARMLEMPRGLPR
jgi:serine/threonine protein kinase